MISPTNVFGKMICIKIIIGTNTNANRHAENIFKTTKPIFDSTFLVIMATFMKIIVIFASSIATATPIMSQWKPISKHPIVSINSKTRIKN